MLRQYQRSTPPFCMGDEGVSFSHHVHQYPDGKPLAWRGCRLPRSSSVRKWKARNLCLHLLAPPFAPWSGDMFNHLMHSMDGRCLSGTIAHSSPELLHSGVVRKNSTYGCRGMAATVEHSKVCRSYVRVLKHAELPNHSYANVSLVKYNQVCSHDSPLYSAKAKCDSICWVYSGVRRRLVNESCALRLACAGRESLLESMSRLSARFET